MTVQRQQYTDSTQTGVYKKYTDRSIQTVHRQELQTVHRQEYKDSTQTGVYRQYTDRSIQRVHRQ
jgi:hypothetical protein